MKDVKIMSAIVRKERCYQWIRHRFQRAVSNCKDKRSPIKDAISLIDSHFGSRRESDKRGQNVENKSGNYEPPITDFIGDHAADDDSKAEACKASAIDVPKLLSGKAELRPPIG